MTNLVLRQALAYAERGWPVFPCLPGQKIPATRHGYRDATTDPQRITEWFARQGGWNLAIATGAPGPDVLDVDQHGPIGNGFGAFARLRTAGLLEGASAYIRTPSGGLHAYFTGSVQRNGHLPTQHLDFRSAGGYVLVPPSQVRGKPYQRVRTLDGQAGLDWQAVIRLLEPDRQYQQPATRPLPDYGITRLVRWVAAQREGNRNAGLFWAANRALDADPAADLNELAAAARQAGLPEQEITRTLNSARRTRHAAPKILATRPKEPADMTTSPRPPVGQAAAASSDPSVVPGDVRDQIRRLQRDGGSYRAIAAAAGLAPATVHDLASGRRPPIPVTARAMSQVTSATLRRARIDAGGSRLRLRALHVMGHGSARIARALGVREMTIRRIVRGDATTISLKLRDAVSDLYDAWWDKRAPERTRFERSAATAARRKAIAGNWCAGAGLDDDELDIPGYRPASGWKPATGTGIAPGIHPPAPHRKSKRP